MKVRDKIGNSLKEGDTIFWAIPGNPAGGLPAVVKSINPSKVLTADGNKVPGTFVLEVELTLPKDETKDVCYGDMLKTFDPRSELIADALAAGVGAGNGKPI